MKVNRRNMALLATVTFLIGVFATALVVNYFYIKPFQAEKERMADINDVITNASFLCGKWKVEEKTFDRDGNLAHITLTAPNRNDRVLIIPMSLDQELRSAWNMKKQGQSVEIIISSWRIKEYLQKGGNRLRAIDLIEPDSINDI
jgi:hypothetical protein